MAAAVATSSAASSPGSSGSSAVYDVSEEKTNGTRLARLLVDGGTHVLRKFLHSIHPPATLQHVLNNNFAKLQRLKSRRVIFDDQWIKLFPASADPPDSETFDITLLHLLLREICHLTMPSTGCHNMPADSDASAEANIIRIKCFRNELCHSVSTGITNGEFKDKWDAISSALVVLGLDQQEVDRLKTEPIGHDTQRRVEEEVNKWKLEIEPRVENLELGFQKLKGRQDDSDQRQDDFEDRISTIEVKLSKVTIHELSSRLPDDVPHVYGRSKETDEVVEAIQNGEEAVVLITGGPGFGKTTVAKRAARELAATAEHGTRAVLFCNVKSTKTLHEVATAMTLVCSEQPQLQENPRLWLQNWSKQLKRNVTFVLDNADDVLDRDSGDEFFSFVSDIRTLSKQKISFVITCRLECNASNLQTKNVRLKCLAGEDAKQVVLSRMKTLQELSKADELVELCGYVPIALCIAGSLLSKAVYTEEELMKCLKQGPLDVLQSNRRPTVDTSVEKSIMTSFEALDDCEMQALILLCSFPGSFDTEAAKVLIAPCLPTTAKGQQVLILTELIDRCLVEQPSTQRYEIHSLIQAAAKKIGRERYPQLLDQGKKLACDHFISRFADNAKKYWSKDKCKESVEAFNEDRHNFEFFLQVYVERRENQDQEVLDTCETTFDNFPQNCMYLEMCVLPRFYTEILQRLLKTFNSERQPVYRVELLCLLGHETRKEGNQQKYKAIMEEAEQIHSKNHTEFETKALSEVYFLNSHARFLSDKKDPKENERREQETETALEVCREKLGEHPETAATLLFSGINAKRRKERNEAEQNLTEALELFKKLLGKHLMTAQCLKAIADLYFFLGRGEAELDKCLAHYAEAIEMLEDLGMSGSKEIVLTLKNFGLCHMRKGNFSEAMNLLTKAGRVAEQELEKYHNWKVFIKTELAFLHEKMGHPDQAKDVMLDGLLMSKRLTISIAKMGNKYKIREFINRYPDTFPEEDFPRM